MIYDFKNEGISTASELKSKIISFNKEVDPSGKRIYDHSLKDVDEQKFTVSYSSTAIVGFYGKAIEQINKNPNLTIGFDSRNLIKYHAIKSCSRFCMSDHED